MYESGDEETEEEPKPKQTNGTEKKNTPVEDKKPVLVEKKQKNSNTAPETNGKGKKNGKKAPAVNQPTLMNFFQRK